MALEKYREKSSFDKTPEPTAEKDPAQNSFSSFRNMQPRTCIMISDLKWEAF